MPKVTVPPNLPAPAAIAADGARTNIIMCMADGSRRVRWSFGATYTAADDQTLPEGIPINITGAAAQLAVSFQGGNQPSVVDVTLI